MKKILFTSLFAACAAAGLSSCMNGDYDANPVATASGTNPLNTGTNGGGGGGGSDVGVAEKGEIRCLLNGSPLVVSGAKWQDLLLRLFSGSKTITNGEQVIAFGITGYTGAGTYPLTTESGSSTGRYTLTDYTSSTIMKDYWTNKPGGGGEVIVTSDANDEMKGTFSFTAINNSEKVTVTKGSFYVTKR